MDCTNDGNSRTCASLGKTMPKNGNEKKCSKKKCQCKFPLYLNDCNECVPQDKCNESCEMPKIKCTGKNEELVPCLKPGKAKLCKRAKPPYSNSCQPDNPWDTQWWAPTFPESENTKAVCIINACDCIKGFLRNECGICVKKSDCNNPCRRQPCDKCSDPNAIRYKRWSECEKRSCENPTDYSSCDKYTDKIYRNFCDCKPGYLRNSCGRCIPKDDCYKPEICKCNNPCNKDKELQCVNSCNMKTCANSLKLFQEDCDNERCFNACVCKGDKYLNIDGLCVNKDQCIPNGIGPIIARDEIIIDKHAFNDTNNSPLTKVTNKTPAAIAANKTLAINATGDLSPANKTTTSPAANKTVVTIAAKDSMHANATKESPIANDSFDPEMAYDTYLPDDPAK